MVRREIIPDKKEVIVELCPEDVQIILPHDPLARTVNGTSQRSTRNTPRKTQVNGESRKRKLKPINEGSDSDASSDSCFEGPSEKNDLFTEGDVEGKKLFPLTPTTPKNKMVVRSSAKKSGSYASAILCTPKNKTPSSAKKSITTPASKSNRKRNLEEEFSKAKKQVMSPSKSPVTAPKTPYQVRSSLRLKLNRKSYKEQMGLDDSGSEFSCDDSDETDDDESSDDSSADEKQTQQNQIRKPIIPLPVAPVKKTAKKEIKYVCSAKDYFHLKGAKKPDKTSDNILNQLKNPSLSHNQFRSILRKITQSHHENSLYELHEDLRYQFKRWMFLLSQNYSVILYGLGSKKRILDTFRKDVLCESKVLVVNGFFPSVTLKEILDGIMKELLNMKEASISSSIAIDSIKRKLDDCKSANHIFLIINNIDGTCLREEKCESALSLLASHKKIHLIASIDHLNAPLIWDVAKLGNLNPVWIDATTFLPYIDEVSFENSFLVKHTGSTMALSSLINVYKSLTTNAKKVYCILVEDHLDNLKNKNYSGMVFIKLYNAAKRDFIVSSDLALRTLLTEFKDHELVKWKRDNEHLTIPVETSVLQKFMNLRNESSI